MLIFVNQLGFGSIVPAVPLYARSFDVPLSAIGLTIAIYGLARFLVNLPVGLISDGSGGAMRWRSAGSSPSSATFSARLHRPTCPFLVGRFVAGLGAGFILTASQIVLADVSTAGAPGRIMATYSRGVLVRGRHRAAPGRRPGRSARARGPVLGLRCGRWAGRAGGLAAGPGDEGDAGRRSSTEPRRSRQPRRRSCSRSASWVRSPAS